MKKIISFSLWGYDPKYCIGAIKNTEIAKSVYPDWVCRFYYGRKTDQNCINQLLNKGNTELISVNEDGDWNGMFWRFFAGDSNDVVIFRDTDSRLNYREKEAVDDWLNSNYDFHVMRDHPWHQTEILGGMWGCRNGILKGISNMIDKYQKGNFYQVDQNFLRSHVHPLTFNNCKIHDEFFNINHFPSKRKGREFVGQPFNADDTECDINHGNLVLGR